MDFFISARYKKDLLGEAATKRNFDLGGRNISTGLVCAESRH